MGATLLSLTAAGLLVPPARHLARAGTVWVALLAVAGGLVATGLALLLFGEWTTSAWVFRAAVVVLLPAAWLGRPRGPSDDGTDEEGGGEGGGGGGPKKPNPDPDAPTPDWDAFDRERERWRDLVH